MHTDMIGFDEALMKNPFDWELRRIYADYLEDQVEEAKAAFQRFAAEVEVYPTGGEFEDYYFLFTPAGKWADRLARAHVIQLELETLFLHRHYLQKALVDNGYAALLDLEDAFVKLYLTGWRPTILPREQS